MKKLQFLALFAGLLGTAAHAALFSLSGNDRLGTDWFYNLDAAKGTNAGHVAPDPVVNNAANSTSYIEHRLLLRPDVLIDERFSIRSEVSLINQNNFNDVVSSVNQVNGGGEFDSTKGNSQNGNAAEQQIKLRYAYLKWNSDIGIFRGGRMPKGWGLGLIYDEGAKAEDDAATIVDRLGFEGQLGSLVLNFGFEKYQEGNLHTDIDDDEVYEGSVKYENEGSGVGIGLLFGRHIRGALSNSKILEKKNSSNDFSFYAKKDWESSSIGGEVASIGYDGGKGVYGGLGQFRWTPGNFEFQADALLSSANGDHAFIVHPNYRPFLILFHESQGLNVGAEGASRFGPSVGFDPTGVRDPANPDDRGERGAMLGKLGFFYSFSQKKYKVGLTGGFAKMLKANTSGSNLGYEADIHFDQHWYDNFRTAVTTGIFIPGDAFRAPRDKSFGFQLRSYLDF